MGTSHFGAPAFSLLLQQHKVVAAFTQRPKPQGRGMQLTLSPIHELAVKSNIPVYTPTTLRSQEVMDLISSIQADVIVVCSYGFIVPKDILEAKKYGCLNIHPSSLPKYRGAAPLQYSIINGDATTEVCVMQMDEGLDTGPVILRQKLDISPNISLSTLHDQCAQIGAELLMGVLQDIAILPRIAQSQNEASYAHKLTKQDGRINWNKSAWEIECQIRGMNPWPGTCFLHEGNEIKLLEASVVFLEHNFKPGTAINDKLMIACGQDALQIKRLQKSGGKALSAQDFLRGYQIPQGVIL